jgi:hypothetical protein
LWPIPKANVNPGKFLNAILRAAKDLERIKRLFGEYAYIADAVEGLTGEPPYVPIPERLTRVEVPVHPFSAAEQQIIAEYPDNHSDMWH